MVREGKTFEQHEYLTQYEGYKGTNLDKINFYQLMPLTEVLKLVINNPEYSNLNKMLSELPNLSLEEIQNLTQKFYNKHFRLHSILTTSEEILRENIDYISVSKTPQESYKKINSLLTEINPMELNIKLVKGHSMYGKIVKPIIIIPEYLTYQMRKMYFSQIELGNQLNLLSVGTLTHEIAHAELESNIGYATDYLDREIISIFLEKVVVLEIDPTGKLLKISEKIRLTDLLNRFNELYINRNKLLTLDTIENLVYIKSILYAEKLFDMYIRELKQGKKDKYFIDIQKVFDGKITVEEFIKTRDITLKNSLDIKMLKRHI